MSKQKVVAEGLGLVRAGQLQSRGSSWKQGVFNKTLDNPGALTVVNT